MSPRDGPRNDCGQTHDDSAGIAWLGCFNPGYNLGKSAAEGPQLSLFSPCHRPRLQPPGRCIQCFVRTGRSSAWLERLVRDQEVAGSNPVTPSFLQERPFGGNVERPSLFGCEACSTEAAFQCRNARTNLSEAALHPWGSLIQLDSEAFRVVDACRTPSEDDRRRPRALRRGGGPPPGLDKRSVASRET